MVAVTARVEVLVERLRLHLVKVEFPGGHHIVVGGRLMSVTADGVATPWRDMPAYETGMFPVPWDEWSEGAHPEVRVLIQRDARSSLRPCSPVRACSLLFNPRGKETVRAWLVRQARGGGQ